MIVNIDWLSFTVPYFLRRGEGGEILVGDSAEEAFTLGLSGIADWMFEHDGWKTGAGRAPYTECTFNTEIGVSVFHSPREDHMLFEFTGQGCQSLRDHDCLMSLMARWQTRVTRIDIACDMETETKPLEFSEKRTNRKFKSGDHKWSSSGETVYVGAQTSDRYARIYRYFDPHPRSKLLRCEMVFRKQNARKVVEMALSEMLLDVARQAGAIYGWTHPVWDKGLDEPTAIKGYTQDRHQGSTIRWLFTQVKPAFKRCLEEGEKEHATIFVQDLVDILNENGYRIRIVKDV